MDLLSAMSSDDDDTSIYIFTYIHLRAGGPHPASQGSYPAASRCPDSKLARGTSNDLHAHVFQRPLGLMDKASDF